MALTASRKDCSVDLASPSNSSGRNSDVSVTCEPEGEKKMDTAIELQRKMIPVNLVFSDSYSRIPPPVTPSTSLCSRIWGAINHGINKVCFFHPTQNFKNKFLQTTYNGAQAFSIFGILQGLSTTLLNLSNSDNRSVAITCTTISATLSVAHFAYTQGMFTDSVTYFKVFRHMFEAAFVSIGDLYRKIVEVAEKVNTLLSLSSLRKKEADAQFNLLQNQIAALKTEVNDLRKRVSQSRSAGENVSISIGSDAKQEVRQEVVPQEVLTIIEIESDAQFFKRVLTETCVRRDFTNKEEQQAFTQKFHKLMQRSSPR